MASLDVNTAFDVAKPEVIAEILEETGRENGWDYRGAGGGPEEGGQFRVVRDRVQAPEVFRQGSVEASRLWLNLAKSTLWNLAEKWEDRGVGQWLGLRETDGPVMQHTVGGQCLKYE